MRKGISIAVITMLSLGAGPMARAADFSVAVGRTGESTTTYRVGAQWNFQHNWFESATGRLSGYWDAGYTYWEGDETSGNHSLSLTPVFAYEFSGLSFKPYVEAGIGIAVFERTRLEDNQLGSSFQFEDRIGAGLRFTGGHELGIRAIHYSNAGIKQPNDGVESYSLHYRRSF
ncbi:acyloxyacyl hydrolase [Pseudomonas indoloxydans]|uniref:Lipid A deacylase n=2 Tax=Pseudomonadales TaxID=72274 RepID=A0A2T5PQ11_ECTOL|nr:MULTISPECIES: acyloxyacyl hydrolase [Pseudomonadaceae]MBP2697398.1 acyloxyacyl hydrolase [Pseudomonas aeruginosa]PTU79806.1 acyloxyacyl hydrolase [Pseudomonas indoloxydans]